MNKFYCLSIKFLNTLSIILFLFLIFYTFTIYAQQPDISIIPIDTTLGDPTAITNAGDGSGRLFIAEQDGQILIYDGTSILNTPFLDIDSKTNGGGERGLLGLAFHPSYSSNGLFYVNYTDLSGDTVVEEYKVSSSNPNIADSDPVRTIITYDQPSSNHNGGHLEFGTDGYLYISSGDGGGSPGNRAQETNNLLGKILRIDVSGDDFPQDDNRNYIIPGDNLIGNEIWVLGLRNPWKFSFDKNGNLFIGDVGQGTNEEIDFQPFDSTGSENYGWQCWEGTDVFDSSCSSGGGFTFPIIEYTHSPGGNCSVTGGIRYRGVQIPELIDQYIYGDFCSGRIWRATEVSLGNWSEVLLIDTNINVGAFGEDEDGELYIADNPFSSGGGLYKLVNNNPQPSNCDCSDPNAILGTSGDDILNGSGVADIICGFGGNDIIKGFGGADCIDGGAGDDVIRGGGGPDELYGGDDNDDIGANGGDDFLDGGSGTDSLKGNNGNDDCVGGEVYKGCETFEPPPMSCDCNDPNAILGTENDDIIDGTTGSDIICGLGGNDLIRGRSGNDCISGGDGDDRLRGGGGLDRVFGGIGNDILRGGGGSDLLNGEEGVDDLDGGNGDDTCISPEIHQNCEIF